MKQNLSLLKGTDYKINDKIFLRHPTLSDIEKIGEEKYQSYIQALTLNPRDIADILFCENNIWYEDIKSDWDFFLEMAIGSASRIKISFDLEDLKGEIEALALGETLKEAFNFFLKEEANYIFLHKEIENSDKGQVFLVKTIQKDGIEIINEDCTKITEILYMQIIDFIKYINWSNPEYLFLKGGTTKAKKYILKNEYKKRKKTKKSNISMCSIFSSLIAKGINFKEIWDMPIYEFYEMYYRFIKINEYQNTSQAYYAGNIDTSKNPINWEKIDWSGIITIKGYE